MKNAKRLFYLDVLRACAIIFVVGIHAHGYGMPDHLQGEFRLDRVWSEFSSLAVPIFFLVDGFITARSQTRAQAPSFKEILAKSAKRLIVPYVCFNLIYVGLRVFFESRGMFPKNYLVGQSWEDIFRNIYLSKIAMQLYFLPTLFLMRLVAAPLRPMTCGSRIGLVLFWLGYIVVMRAIGFRLGDDPLTHAFVEFPYFLFGMVLYRLETCESRWPMLIMISCGLVACLQRLIPTPLFWVPISFGIAKYGFMLLFYFVSKWPGWEVKPVIWLGRHTMQIYLLHAPVLMKVIQIVVNRSVEVPSTRFLMIWVATLVASILLTILLARIPRSGWLFGDG